MEKPRGHLVEGASSASERVGFLFQGKLTAPEFTRPQQALQRDLQPDRQTLRKDPFGEQAGGEVRPRRTEESFPRVVRRQGFQQGLGPAKVVRVPDDEFELILRAEPTEVFKVHPVRHAARGAFHVQDRNRPGR